MITFKRLWNSALMLTYLFVSAAFAQHYNVPLSMEGLDHSSSVSILSKSMGGVSLTSKKDISLMFTNPASLGTLEGLTISAGTSMRSASSTQVQQWYPLFSFGSFSTLMDGSTRGIVPTGTATSPADTNWVPFDDLGPNWNYDYSSKIIPNIFIGMPIKISNMKLSVGLGYAEYANMDYYYQNNNDLFPEYDLVTVGTPGVAADSLRRIDWYQSIHNREGTLQSFGGALALDIKDVFSIGLSIHSITGKTDDYNSHLGRGAIWFYSGDRARRDFGLSYSNPCIRVDSAVYTNVLSGTSDFSGLHINLGTQYRGKNVSIGASLTLPVTITREFRGSVQSDTLKRKIFAESHYRNDTSYTEKMNLPLRAKIGIGIQLRPNIFMAAELEFLPYELAELENNGVKTNPWLGGTAFHFGMTWNPLEEVALRIGYRRQKEVFTAQYSAYPDDPIAYNAYSTGLGLNLNPNLVLNIAYEYYERKYEDVWAQSYHINSLKSHALSAELSYTVK